MIQRLVQKADTVVWAPSKQASQFKDLSAIIELQQEVATSDLPLSGLMDLVCHKTQNLTLATGAVVEMAEGEHMVYRACTGSLQSSIGVRLSIHTSLSGMSVTTNQVLYCEDSETDPRVDREACRRVGARSMICVPLQHHQKTVGVLKVVSVNEKAFSERDVDVLRLIAGLLSAAISQAAEADAKEKALASLTASEKKFRTLIQAASEGILISEGGRVLDANPAFCQIFGYELKEIIGTSVERFVAPSLRHTVSENLKRDSSGVSETLCQKKDSSVFVAESIGKNIELEGKIIRVTTLRDITVRRQTEESLRQSELKAREATRVKSEFLANISHEIRTPINGVMGMANLLLDSKIQGEERQYVEIIKRSADSLLNLVNDVLDFSKFEAQKMRLEEIDFDVRHVVMDIYQTLKYQAEQKHLGFQVILPDTLSQSYRGDPTRLRQILLNLVNNAMKFTHKGDVTIRLSESILTPASQKSVSLLKFEVQDTGIGIPEEAYAAMFKPFSQVDASTTRKYGGTGLGLSICKQLVDLMQGQIGVKSAAGKGSTFWFEVPLTFASLGAPSPSEFSHSASPKKSDLVARKLRVLIAEDNTVNQLIAVKMVEKLGHSATVAANGKEVLAALKLAPYDLILMDCQMPEMDGYEATTQIRKNPDPEIAHIQIVAMTANVLAGDYERCLQVGMNDYVPKPVKIEELEAALQKCFRKEFKKIS